MAYNRTNLQMKKRTSFYALLNPTAFIFNMFYENCIKILKKNMFTYIFISLHSKFITLE
jgi:hypothetical protein